MYGSFWSGRRVFITGHSGFKGAWLAFWLSRLGAKVTGFSLAPETTPNLFDGLAIPTKVTSRFGDVRDLSGLRHDVQIAEPEVLFHMAAQANVRVGYAQPVVTFATNVMGTVHALESARDVDSLRALVVVTSDKCYRNDNRLSGYREDDVLGGDEPYSSSKACAEMVATAYRHSFFEGSKCAVATARAGNVIGGGDWSKDRLVPDVVRALVAKSRPRLRNPTATRPWQHVLDALAGYLALAEALWNEGSRVAGCWNFGPAADESMSVADLAALVCDAWGEKLDWKRDIARSPAEWERLAVNAAKARSRLQWEPRLSAADAVRWTVEWYKAWQRGGSVEGVTADQIDRYEAYSCAN